MMTCDLPSRERTKGVVQLEPSSRLFLHSCSPVPTSKPKSSACSVRPRNSFATGSVTQPDHPSHGYGALVSTHSSLPSLREGRATARGGLLLVRCLLSSLACLRPSPLVASRPSQWEGESSTIPIVLRCVETNGYGVRRTADSLFHIPVTLMCMIGSLRCVLRAVRCDWGCRIGHGEAHGRQELENQLEPIVGHPVYRSR